MSDKIILVEKGEDKSNDQIVNPRIDGKFAEGMRNVLTEENDKNIANAIFSNAISSLKYFSNPQRSNKKTSKKLFKILCIGRVQSGKTSFFHTVIALAFDNGYDIAYLIGGTKLPLKEQNYERVKDHFGNNFNVQIYDVNSISVEDIEDSLSHKYKIILVSLKNASSLVNLGKIQMLSERFRDIATLIVDDEGDEYSPGAPNIKKQGKHIGVTHDAISKILDTLQTCTYLAVTATPQANFLISTIDEVSPDHAILIDPGPEYTGGNAFHDTMDNPHVPTIDDESDFIDSVPSTFQDALHFFVFAACLTRARGNKSMPLSMLVHPSSLTRIQKNILIKIKREIYLMYKIFNDPNERLNFVEGIWEQKQVYEEMNPNSKILDINNKLIEKEIPDVLANLEPFLVNRTLIGKEYIKREKEANAIYKIYVGGNMLGRGLTLKNLIVTYIYRDSNLTAIDTLYQRARWLGYKKSYFDLCRVYMTSGLKRKFIYTVESENDLWSTLRTFLKTDDNIKKFPRLFTLNGNDELILTRKSVTKTITVSRVSAGFKYDKSLYYKNEDEIECNRFLFFSYLDLHKAGAKEQCFSNNGYQTHLIITTTYTNFYDEFLSKYILPKGSKFGYLGFAKMKRQVQAGEMSDDLKVMIMRYKHYEYRTLEVNKAIGELLQSYNAGTDYAGDKNLPGYQGITYFQIHAVYVNKNEPEKIIPVLAFNNPLTNETIKYVTGTNYYG